MRQTVDAAAKVTLRRSYEPFGGLHTAKGLDSAYGFAGEEQDAATGHVYLRARTYNPYLNRFLSADTILPDFRNPQNLNLHAYVNNNPVNRVDPTGHCIENYPPGSSQLDECVNAVLVVRQTSFVGHSFWQLCDKTTWSDY